MEISRKLKMKSEKKNKGFSLLETLVAISILMITIVGPLTLASKGIVFADYVKDEITGFYLAQEAIEAIRNIRDTNKKNGSLSWLEIIKDKCLTDAGALSLPIPCRIDIWNFSDTSHGLQSCPEVYNVTACDLDQKAGFEKMSEVVIDNSAGRIKLYGHTFNENIKSGVSPEDSIFSRRITITPVNYEGQGLSDDELFETQFDLSGIDEVNVAVEVYWTRSALRDKSPDKRYSERKIKVSENMFSI